MIDAKGYLETYSKQLASQGSNRIQLLRYASDFLDYLEASEGDISRENVQRYLDRLKKKHGYSDSTMNLVFRALKRVFETNGVQWPFRRGDSPRINEDDVNAPALDPDVIIELIKAAKSRKDNRIKAFMAISTTYGTRRTEMLELTQKDVNLKDAVLHIGTLKHGRDRMHLIPQPIIPYLEAYNFDERVSSFSLLMDWYRLENAIGMQRIEGVGWHSVRRTLNTLLMKELPEATVMSFLRWKQRTSSHMPYRYSAQRFVGKDGIQVQVVGNALDVDTAVFQVHPFLEAWQD